MNRDGVVTRTIGRLLRRFHAGDRKLAAHKLVPALAPSLSVTCPSFADGHSLPLSATALDEGKPPVLVVQNVPPSAGELVVICEDPDAPMAEPFVHWTLYGIEGRNMTIDARVVAATSQGKNSELEMGYTPPDPPPGHGVHHFHFQVFALDTPLRGEPRSGSGRTELLEQMRGHVLAWGDLVGTFERA
jgi:Raf kinase inhibitor-like YbhB/YbcL family protein